MRIIAGQLGGRRLLTPKDATTRPTTDRVRESLFSILQNGYGELLQNSNVLDLFAGTGSLGFEAISRGAGSCVFVDNSPSACVLIKENIANFGLEEKCTVKRANAADPATLHIAQRFRLVFLDPPYNKQLGDAALAAVIKNNLLEPNALLVLEDAADCVVNAPDGLAMKDQRRYGNTKLSFLVN